LPAGVSGVSIEIGIYSMYNIVNASSLEDSWLILYVCINYMSLQFPIFVFIILSSVLHLIAK